MNLLLSLRPVLMVVVLICSVVLPQAIARGGEDGAPWPWGKEMPFPWKEVEGSWITTRSLSPQYFSFRVMDSRSAQGGEELYLEVRQYNALTHERLGRGLGVESRRVVRALLASPEGSYSVMVRAYHKDHPFLTQQEASAWDEEQIMVLSIVPSNRHDESLTGGSWQHFVLEKISDDPICYDEFDERPCLDLGLGLTP